MTRILPKAVAFGRAMFMLTKPSLSCGPQAYDELMELRAGQLSTFKILYIVVNKDHPDSCREVILFFA
ncbi:hypothetical protein [Cytobacillus firmus]|uniref:hypothetical protein n=1 Tax=Cytobacillus firmus TaxID=1399 RepID=UPI00203A735C|nr:hypothetical protein [Cytobacillus firmus]